MKIRLAFLISILTLQICLGQTKINTPYYELRTCWASEGKLPVLLDLFRNHTMQLFEKHGMKNIGYWVPVENKENKLVYLLAYPSAEARETSWKEFEKDPEWQKAKSAAGANGKIIEKLESTFLTETDYSPADFSNRAGRVFELRTYTTTPYNLGLLHARFRNHTLALFAKHGMSNLIYMTAAGKDNNLTYFLSHASQEAAKESFAKFVADPEWIKARDASETLAKGPILVGITSEFLIPTDFSPWK